MFLFISFPFQWTPSRMSRRLHRIGEILWQCGQRRLVIGRYLDKSCLWPESLEAGMPSRWDVCGLRPMQRLLADYPPIIDGTKWNRQKRVLSQSKEAYYAFRSGPTRPSLQVLHCPWVLLRGECICSHCCRPGLIFDNHVRSLPFIEFPSSWWQGGLWSGSPVNGMSPLPRCDPARPELSDLWEDDRKRTWTSFSFPFSFLFGSKRDTRTPPCFFPFFL